MLGGVLGVEAVEDSGGVAEDLVYGVEDGGSVVVLESKGEG